MQVPPASSGLKSSLRLLSREPIGNNICDAHMSHEVKFMQMRAVMNYTARYHAAPRDARIIAGSPSLSHGNFTQDEWEEHRFQIKAKQTPPDI